jgi:hypothetical protein
MSSFGTVAAVAAVAAVAVPERPILIRPETENKNLE